LTFECYSMLQELVDLEGYYLEREPCMTCNDPEIPYNSYKLNNIKVMYILQYQGNICIICII